MNKRNTAIAMMASSMAIFGSIGLFVRNIPLQSSMIALVRAIIGTVFLLLVLLGSGKRLSGKAIGQNLVLLILSGAAIGFNWILLFESYRYTSVSVSTLCYYMAPILVILFSPLLLGETLRAKKLICVVIAVAGMYFVSGVHEGGSVAPTDAKGMVFGLGAAALYASAILMNKKMKPIPAFDRTIVQMAVAGGLLLPYTLFTCDFSGISLTWTEGILLIVVGIVHTGLAYYLYFGSLTHLPAQSAAIISYLDPVIAVILSVSILREPLSGLEMVGAVLILGAAFFSEISVSGRRKQQ